MCFLDISLVVFAAGSIEDRLISGHLPRANSGNVLGVSSIVRTGHWAFAMSWNATQPTCIRSCGTHGWKLLSQFSVVFKGNGRLGMAFREDVREAPQSAGECALRMVHPLNDISGRDTNTMDHRIGSTVATRSV
jgi:hypothetical protein